MNFRKIGFELISKLKSTPVNSYINEFKLSKEAKERLALRRLDNIIELAKYHTEFYKDYNTFKEFPIISKEILRDQYNEFLSNQLNKNNSITTTTSGSSGQPMTFYLSKNKKYRQNAEVIFYNSWANIEVGEYHAYIRVTESKSKLKLAIQNQVLMNPKNLSDAWLKEQINILINKNITSIIGYPSAIAAIAEKSLKLKNGPEEFHLKGIVTSGESLKLKDIEIIKKAFDIAPISRYSTEEFGVLGCMCPKCGYFHLNDTGYIIELLDIDSDKHVKPGEVGRVVVTDLFSDYMPLIRFDTGDLAIYGGESDCSYYPTGKVVHSIIGRQIETVYDIKGNKISPFAVNGALRDFNNIKSFQFIQNDLMDNELDIIINGEFTKRDEQLILERFNSILGTEPKIEIVNEIKPLKSGKRPYIINNFLKENKNT